MSWGGDRKGRESHVLLHVCLILFTLVAIYPVLWVISVAFSGTQNLAFADLPPDPGFVDRLRAIVPWPGAVSMKNFIGGALCRKEEGRGRSNYPRRRVGVNTVKRDRREKVGARFQT
mgnify:CR=1 FL=1